MTNSQLLSLASVAVYSSRMPPARDWVDWIGRKAMGARPVIDF